MNPEQLIDQLLALHNAEEQRKFLDAHRTELTPQFFEALKAHSDAQALREPNRALEIVEVATMAASLVADPLGNALTHWAGGNVFLCLEQHEQALQHYGTACERYREADESTYRLEIARLQTNMVAVLKSLGRYREGLSLANEARAALAPWPMSRYMAVLEMNAGSLYRHVGRYGDALNAYERGRAIFATLGNTVQAARIDINRARLLGVLDRFAEAEPLLERARDALLAEEATLPAARAELNRATLLSRQGRHREAIAAYRQAREAFTSLGVQADVATVSLYLSYDYLALNLLPEARDESLSARDKFAALKMPRYVALANGNLAIAARKVGDYANALTALEAARAFFAERGVAVEVARLDLERAICLREMGRADEAAPVIAEACRILREYGTPLHSAMAQIVLGDTLLAQGKNPERCDELYISALDTLKDMPSLAWQAHAGRGRVAEARGHLQQAYQHYQEAIRCLEEAEEALGSAAYRAGFLADKLDVYQQAVRVSIALKNDGRTLRLVQRAKVGVWRDFVAQKSAEGTPVNLQDLRRRWHWLYNRLTRQDVDGEERGGEQVYWKDLREVESLIVQARREKAPPTARQAPPSLEDVLRSLPAGTAFLDYYCAGGNIVVQLLRDGESHIFANLASLRDVKRQLDRWRFNQESVRLAITEGRPAVELADEAHSVLKALYSLLWEQIEPQLDGVASLWISPHEMLWAVPFAALHDGKRYLAERYDITHTPGLLAPLPFSRPPTVSLADAPLAVGFSNGNRLTYAVSEAQAVNKVLGGGRLLIEDQATTERVEREAATCTLLHLATHGFFREDAPLFSTLHLADGPLTAERLETWQLPKVELVTLSACETGVTLSRGSDLLGLARGFWRAGARRMMVSLWAVDDVSTADLMTHFYAALREGQPVSRALRSAQMSALLKYRHPFYWAGFAAVEF